MRLFLIIITPIVIILGLALELGGCANRYRYPCQDPANWNKVECNNDACRAEGDCTSQVLGASFLKREDDVSVTESSPDDLSDAAPKKTIPNTKNNISNNSHQSEHNASEPDSMPIAEREPVFEGERPLTMDTIVSTHEHNLAAR